jgi:hypothetical protein
MLEPPSETGAGRAVSANSPRVLETIMVCHWSGVSSRPFPWRSSPFWERGVCARACSTEERVNDRGLRHAPRTALSSHISEYALDCVDVRQFAPHHSGGGNGLSRTPGAGQLGHRGGYGSHQFGRSWPNAPHRTLRTAFVRQWLGHEARGQESRPDEPAVGQTVIAGQPMPVLRFMGFPPNCDASGDIESMDLLAGQGVGLVGEIKSARQIVRELVEEARQIVSRRLARFAAGG